MRYISAKGANARCPVAGMVAFPLTLVIKKMWNTTYFGFCHLIVILSSLIISACPRVLTPSKVLCDPLLLIEIEEMRNSMTDEAGRTIEDFTAIDEED